MFKEASCNNDEFNRSVADPTLSDKELCDYIIKYNTPTCLTYNQHKDKQEIINQFYKAIRDKINGK